jgi:formylglycine-generating enzyme required for sulfatase activity
MCSPTATQCMGTVPQTCNAAGTWVNGSVTAGQCGALCTPTMTQCMGAIPQTCDAIGGWQNHAVTAGQCGAVCNPTATTCSGNSVKPCGADGQWGTPVACSGNTPVCLPATGECVACAPQTTKCSDGQNLLTCGTDGAWMSPAACPVAMPYCYQGSCASAMKPSSCQRGGAGLSDCGPSGEDCCTSFSVPGGTYYRSYDGVTLGFTTQDSPATISSFRLDKYEVTMGRFRQFVNAIVGGFFVGTGSGKHIHLNSGQGLADSGSPGSFESGWDVTWNSSMASTMAGWTANLQCPLGGSMGDWTATPGANESRPIDCETWFEAYAFCIWDGGFLPSEAEWNYAAAGGAEQRVYPWSVPPTSTNIDCTYANFDEGSAGCPSLFVNNNVGSNSPKGDGKWGHTDLAGNAAEWGLDWTASPYDKPCTDCAHLTPSQSAPGTYKTVRGGGSSFSAHALITAIRNQNNVPTTRHPDIGFRCARTP